MTLWKKASAVVGLSGLTPREAVRGALTCPEFQNMPDPLDKDPFGPVAVKAEVRNIFYRVLLFWNINEERVDTLNKIHCIYVRGSMRQRMRVNCGMNLEIPWD